MDVDQGALPPSQSAGRRTAGNGNGGIAMRQIVPSRQRPRRPHRSNSATLEPGHSCPEGHLAEARSLLIQRQVVGGAPVGMAWAALAARHSPCGRSQDANSHSRHSQPGSSPCSRAPRRWAVTVAIRVSTVVDHSTVGDEESSPLWLCPKCGRPFAHRNQTHTCRPLVDLRTTSSVRSRQAVLRSRAVERRAA